MLLPLLSLCLLLSMPLLLLLLFMRFGMLFQALTPSKSTSTYTALKLAIVCMCE
jgi:hypothetical protein